MRHRNRGRGIESIVAPRHGQSEIVDLVHDGAGAVAKNDGEARATIGMVEGRSETVPAWIPLTTCLLEPARPFC